MSLPRVLRKQQKLPKPSTEPTTEAKGKSEANQPASDKCFTFRTVRVDDPDLVHDLEKAGVKFTGVAPSFMSEFLWAWILPIGLMVLLWVFCPGGWAESASR